MTFGHADLVYRINKIGFAHAVLANQAIDTRRAMNQCLGIVLKIIEFNLF